MAFDVSARDYRPVKVSVPHHILPEDWIKPYLEALPKAIRGTNLILMRRRAEKTGQMTGGDIRAAFISQLMRPIDELIRERVQQLVRDNGGWKSHVHKHELQRNVERKALSRSILWVNVDDYPIVTGLTIQPPALEHSYIIRGITLFEEAVMRTMFSNFRVACEPQLTYPQMIADPRPTGDTILTNKRISAVDAPTDPDRITLRTTFPGLSSFVF